MKRSLALLSILLAGCSSVSGGTTPVPSDSPPTIADTSGADTSGADTSGELKVDLFSARGFLGGSEYERYYLSGKVLWRECGSISPSAKQAGAKSGIQKSSLEGDEVLSKDPQLTIQERRVERLSADQVQAVRRGAFEVLTAAGKSAERHEPPPGSVFSLGSPGLFEMLVTIGEKKERVISSVDAVADKKSSTLEKAHELFSMLRGVGPEMCGARTFYGIERRSL